MPGGVTHILIYNIIQIMENNKIIRLTKINKLKKKYCDGKVLPIDFFDQKLSSDLKLSYFLNNDLIDSVKDYTLDINDIIIENTLEEGSCGWCCNWWNWLL